MCLGISEKGDRHGKKKKKALNWALKCAYINKGMKILNGGKPKHNVVFKFVIIIR